MLPYVNKNCNLLLLYINEVNRAAIKINDVLLFGRLNA